jgi:hypothetical protein
MLAGAMTKPPPPRFSITLEISVGVDISDAHVALAIGTALQHTVYLLSLCRVQTITITRKTIVALTDDKPDDKTVQALEEVAAVYLDAQEAGRTGGQRGTRKAEGRVTVALLPNAGPLDAARAELGESVVGLVVEHQGSHMQLFHVAPDDPERDPRVDYLWEASAMADPVDDGPEQCCGRGMTPMEALDDCAAMVDDAETDPSEDDETESEAR